MMINLLFILLAFMALTSTANAAVFSLYEDGACYFFSWKRWLTWYGNDWIRDIDTSGWHGMKAEGCIMQVKVFEYPCGQDGGAVFTYALQDGECFNVNNGFDWNCSEIKCLLP